MKNKIPIAVVGIGGIFPGASDTDTFWQNILHKKDTCREIPDGRWAVHPDFMFSEKPASDKTYSRKACLVSDFKFDSAGLDIDKNILQDIDPLYQFVLHAGREAFSDCATGSVNRKKTGVVLAAIALPTDASSSLARKITGHSYRNNFNSSGLPYDARSISKKEAISACVTSMPASILSKGLGISGGCFTLDAACASSIYAVKLACDELSSRRADAMLAGGVSRPDCLYTQVGFSQLRALSPSGRCSPFDEKADGLVVGEGAGILFLKRLDDAIIDKDRIYAVIRGIGLSNDIGGNLLSPDPEGQVRAMKQAYDSAGWNPWDVDLIECHGTGTPAGDYAEVAGLVELWGKSGWSEAQCPVGSVKSMIGHLLTGAGAAGMIKTLLAMKHNTLPPSLHFNKAPDKSHIHGSPFKVQTETEEWRKRAKDIPRRAAVSAFGFGGINGHILFEEPVPDFDSKKPPIRVNSEKNPEPAVYENPVVPVAIIGMDAFFGKFRSLSEFQQAIFNGDTSIGERPAGRWKGSYETSGKIPEATGLNGSFINEFDFDAGRFHIPPLEIPDILPQHLLILKVASGAMIDAGLPLREKRPRMGAVLGAEFDYGATDFQLRWNQKEKSDPDAEVILDAISHPLTSSRTLGALGGIIASRIAREFRLGGPSFVVSCDAASGLKALETGMRFIQENIADMMLVGAVDLAGDIRNIAVSNALQPFSKAGKISPFDISSSGTLPGEGAGAVVIKRLDKAIEENDRIYAVIKGFGKAGGGIPGGDMHLKEAYSLSLEKALSEASLKLSDIGYFETHGSGDPVEDGIEIGVIESAYKKLSASCALGSVKPNIGHTGASSGLASLIKAVLCLYHEAIPPVLNFTHPKLRIESGLHFPGFIQYWYRDRIDGPRRACTASITRDGNCMHILLEGYEYKDKAKTPLKALTENNTSLPRRNSALFIIEGNTKKELLEKLDLLSGSIDKSSLYDCGFEWFNRNKPDYSNKYALSIVAGDIFQLRRSISEAKNTVETGSSKKMNGSGGICYSPEPLGCSEKIAFVFPGSGNHYVGMGRGIGVYFPEILKNMDRRSARLKTQIVPEYFMPWRSSWQNGWENDVRAKIAANPLNMIFGQVLYGGIISSLVTSFGVRPSAVIGYSLGESAGNFAMNLWPDHEEMLKRMADTDLFSAQLAGPCHSARKAWKIPQGEDFDWCAAAVNRPAGTVRTAIEGFPLTRLLIINTPDECVIGGRKKDVEGVIAKLKCEAVFLEGVVTVHCDAVTPVAGEYRNLHLFPVTPPEGIEFYSCALGRSFEVTSESAADSILMQATDGFDFASTIEQAYKDGIRIFLEMGPHSSCTRMIDRILGERDHLAVSASFRGEDEYLSFLKLLGALASERIPFDIGKLYSYQDIDANSRIGINGRIITLSTYGSAPLSSHDAKDKRAVKTGDDPQPVIQKPADVKACDVNQSLDNDITGHLGFIELISKNIELTSEAHRKFLTFSNDLSKAYSEALELQIDLIRNLDNKYPPEERNALFTRDMCMEFATGSVAKVLGPEFAVVDTYRTRVRLPDEPLMLVDRIISVEGKKSSLGSGKVTTEHDVLPGAWYLDGNRAPVCISVEAGQADLFLCSYLGIDLAVKGERTYRLLDATVKFHRGLPQPGDTIRYEIEIEKFVKQKDTYLFFFKFEGYIGGRRLITMRDGCAGFFTEEEVKNSGGIILTEKETARVAGKKPVDWIEPVSFNACGYDDISLDSLRDGNLAGCFGPLFNGIKLSDSLRLPGGRMKLIDRITSLNPNGGRFGLGIIRAEADIHPDDWFLTCHFKDDMVMPGTLMYECCAHTLRVFLMRMGWVAEKPGVCFEPVPGIESVLKCRGPVTPETRKVVYEVEIKEIGYDPEPYVLADAYMYADGQRIVSFRDMSIKMTGVTRDEIESLWNSGGTKKDVLFNRDRILAFSVGNPSEAFGDKYKIFDSERRVARLPGPPYLFMDRITKIEPEQWILKPGGWIEAEYDIPPDAWYFRANRSHSMPFAVILETALQPCGWLAAYMGSALKSKKDLKFRNLGGTAVLHGEIYPDSGTLTMRARTKKISEAGEMIIEEFDMQVLQAGKVIYEGETVFGFFSDEALSKQVGIRNIDKEIYRPSTEGTGSVISHIFTDEAPLNPNDAFRNDSVRLAMPSKALRMIDSVKYIETGGPESIGYASAVKIIDPSEWFFDAHFYQDPVCPGSLGIESFLQTMKFIAMKKWGHLAESHKFSLFTGAPHSWLYRGQILRNNKTVEIETYVNEIGEEPVPYIKAYGYLKVDGLYIYKMNNFGLKLVPV